MTAPRFTRNLLIGLGCLIVVGGIANIEVEAPADVRGPHVARGRLVACEFSGVSGGNFFVGMTLDTPGLPHLRHNPPNTQRSQYEAMCQRKPQVKVTYQAKKRLVGPVRFWITDITESRPRNSPSGSK